MRQVDLSGSPCEAPLPRLAPDTQHSREQRECRPALALQRPTATLPSVTPGEEGGDSGGPGAAAGPRVLRGGQGSGEGRGEGSGARAAPARPRPAPAAARGQVRGGGAAAPARGAAESAGPAARGDAALQLGAHGHRHHPPEAARRRRPLPAEGARGSAGERRGLGGAAKRRLDSPPRVVTCGAPFSFSSPPPYFRCFQVKLAVCESIFSCVLCSCRERKSFWGVLRAFCSSRPWPVL